MNSIYWHPRPFSARTLVFVLVSGPLGGNFEIGLEYNLFRLVIQDQSRLVERRYFITLSLLMFFPSHIFHYNLNSNKTCVKIKSLSEVSRSHQLMWWSYFKNACWRKAKQFSSLLLVFSQEAGKIFSTPDGWRLIRKPQIVVWGPRPLWTGSNLSVLILQHVLDSLVPFQAWTRWRHADLTDQKTEW